LGIELANAILSLRHAQSLSSQLGGISGSSNPEGYAGQAEAHYTDNESTTIAARDIIYVATKPGADSTTYSHPSK